jgi:hypothetical protein
MSPAFLNENLPTHIAHLPQLSRGRTPRRVHLSEFKNMRMVNIREFYEKDDEYLPSKKVRAVNSEFIA